MTEKSEEVCESCELHENLLKIVKEMMPEETELYDLAELFKVFGDSTFCLSCLKQKCASVIWQRL